MGKIAKFPWLLFWSKTDDEAGNERDAVAASGTHRSQSTPIPRGMIAFTMSIAHPVPHSLSNRQHPTRQELATVGLDVRRDEQIVAQESESIRGIGLSSRSFQGVCRGSLPLT